MFKSARWRSDKNKIKAVFKLQFHATQVSWSGGDTLMISLIPADGAKPTSITDKVKIRDGSCYWEKPLYETMKFTRDPKTGKINERSYHVTFSTGLSKFGALGEVSIDFADYALATKLASLSLLLKNTKFEAVLNVTIERIQDSVDQREIEEGGTLKDNSKDQSLRAHLSNSDIDEDDKTKNSEEESFNKIISHVTELNENRRASCGSEVTTSRGDPRALLEELRQELNHEKDLNANLRIQLQKTQESNSELILAVQDLDEMLEEKNKEILDLSNRSETTKNAKNIWETDSRCSVDLDEDQNCLEKLVMQHTDARDADMQEKKIIDLCGEVEIYKRERDDLEMQMEQLALDYEILKQENHDISSKLKQSQLQDQLKMQYECSECAASFSALDGYKIKIESLETELKKQSKEFSDSLLGASNLENYVKSLEEELEKQARSFEADLENLTRSKVEQEQRAIRAEENLRKTRWRNANTAVRLQEEFKRLSEQMDSTFLANEKLATKALTEAGKLLTEKNCLEGMLREAKKEILSVTEHHEAKLLEISRQLESKLNQIEKLQSEVEHKSVEFKNQRKHAEESRRTLSQEIQSLQSEIGRLERLNNFSTKQAEESKILRAELEQMKASVEDTELLLEKAATERNDLESMAALLKVEGQSLLKDLNIMRSVKDEAKSMTKNLRSELETLKKQYDELKHFSAVESQKEKYQKQEKIRLLEGQLKLKEAALEMSSKTFLEKEKDLQRKIEDLEKSLEILNQNAASLCGYECQKLKEDGGNLDAEIGEEAKRRAENLNTAKCTTEEIGFLPALVERNNDTSSDNELKDPGTDSKDCRNQDKLLNEMELLKERNISMECDLRDMQQRYSEISLKFAEVEGERQQLVMTLRNFKNPNKSWSLFT
ncbi:Keratin, type I cytoskeletal 18 [Heracleum sosnowskyi]|uniref:Keratin, type I cytoskeletal 18 n=1 Tax=Heracleum sosnowskyi TaxID=360622 RepID=A0AAD8GRN7_9APIA|nr:Keratin, type I cytoskeletal 18 [Heracleum sosnowskyi]